MISLIGFSTNATLFADDTSLFSIIHDNYTSTNDLSKDLDMIHNWAFQWKMSFNPDLAEQAQEEIFSHEKKIYLILPWCLIMKNVTQSVYQKYLGIMLDSKLTFENHLKRVTTKLNKYSSVNYKTYYQ